MILNSSKILESILNYCFLVYSASLQACPSACLSYLPFLLHFYSIHSPVVSLLTIPFSFLSHSFYFLYSDLIPKFYCFNFVLIFFSKNLLLLFSLCFFLLLFKYFILNVA